MKTLLLFVSVIVLSCGLSSEEESKKYISVHPSNFEIVTQDGQNVRLRMTTSCGSACWIDFKDLIEQQGTKYSIQSLARSESNMCTLQCVIYSREYDLTLDGPGDYQFIYIHADTVAKRIDFSY